jgi:rRNA maturation protein Nop10
MTTIVTVECEECGGKSVVKIPNGFDEDYRVEACPLCGASWQGLDDFEGEE